MRFAVVLFWLLLAGFRAAFLASLRWHCVCIDACRRVDGESWFAFLFVAHYTCRFCARISPLGCHLDCTTYAVACTIFAAMLFTHAIVHVPPYRALDIIGEQAAISSEPESGIPRSVDATPVERSISSRVGNVQKQAATEEADTGRAVTAKEWQGTSKPLPAMGQRATKQVGPVVLELDARPTARRVLTGAAVGAGEVDRSGGGGVCSPKEEDRRKEQPDVGLMVRGGVLSRGWFTKQ